MADHLQQGDGLGSAAEKLAVTWSLAPLLAVPKNTESRRPGEPALAKAAWSRTVKSGYRVKSKMEANGNLAATLLYAKMDSEKESKKSHESNESSEGPPPLASDETDSQASSCGSCGQGHFLLGKPGVCQKCGTEEIYSDEELLEKEKAK